MELNNVVCCIDKSESEEDELEGRGGEVFIWKDEELRHDGNNGFSIAAASSPSSAGDVLLYLYWRDID